MAATEVVGEASPAGRAAKATSLARRVRELVSWSEANEIDLALSHNSYRSDRGGFDSPHSDGDCDGFRTSAGESRRFPSLNADTASQALAGDRFVGRQGVGRRARYYDGFKEEISLGDFKPDREVLTRLGLAAQSGKLVVVARTPPSRALYHGFANPLFLDALQAISDDGRSHMVVLCRFPEQRAEISKLGLENCTLPDRAVDSRSLMAMADLVIGAGGTMTREAALLGTPTVSVFAGRPSAVDKSLARAGKLRIAQRLDDILPIRHRTTKPASSADLAFRAEMLVDRFVQVIDEAAQVPPTERASIAGTYRSLRINRDLPRRLRQRSRSVTHR